MRISKLSFFFVALAAFSIPEICFAQAKGLLTFEDGEAGAWNGFFPMNVVECLNSGPDQADLRITAYKLDGQTLDTRDISIAKDATVHTIVNEFRNPTTGETTANSYGLFTVKRLNSAQKIQVSCLSVFYSIAPGSSVPSYAFAKRVEKIGGNKSRYLFVNSMSRGGAPTYNWVTSMNTGSRPVTMTIDAYDSLGAVAGQQSFALAPGERKDFGYHDSEGLRFLAINRSDTSVPVQTFSTRINGTNFAFGTDATTGSCDEPVQASTTANGKAWIVYANPSEAAVKGKLVIRDQSGNVLNERSLDISGKRQESVFLNPIIDPGNNGAIGTATIECDDRNKPFVYQIEHYGFRDGGTFVDPNIWAYANQANDAPTAGANDSLVAFTNTFLGDKSFVTANWTNVANSGNASTTAQFDVHASNGSVLRSNTYNIGANGSLNLDSHGQLGGDTVGTSVITANGEGAALSGQHLRVFYAKGKIATILVTPLTLISKAAPLDGEFGGIASLRPYRSKLTDNEIFRAFNTFGMGAPPWQIDAVRSGGLEALADIIVNQPLVADVETRALDAAAFSYAMLTNPSRPAWTVSSLQNWLIAQFRYASPARAQTLLMFMEWFAENFATFSGVGETQHFIDEHRKILSDLALGSDTNFEHAMNRLVESSYFGVWLNLSTNRINGGNQDGTREFVELATMGPVDAVHGTPNYDQAHIENSRLALTGFFQSTVTLGDGTRKTVVGYSPQDHYHGSIEVFPGTSYSARSSFSYPQYIEHVLFNAPPTSHYVASNLISSLLRPDPDAAVTLQLADELLNNAYDLRPSIERLVKSSYAFSASNTGKSCVISPIEAVMRVARTLNIPITKSSTYTTIRDLLNNTSQLLGNYPTVFGGIGSCGKFQGGVISRGDRWNEASSRLFLTNYITTFLNGAVANEGFQMSSLLPPGIPRPTGRQMVDHLLGLFGLNWTEAEKVIGEQYFNTQRINGSNRAVVFDAGVPTHVNMKIAGFITDFIAIHPQFLTK